LIKSIQIDNGITGIGERAFSGCNNVNQITLSNTVTKIGYYSFKDCTSLPTLNLPKSVSKIDSTAFINCTSLVAINVSKENSYFTDVAGVLYSAGLKTLLLFPANYKESTYCINNTTEKIGAYAFYGNKNLKNISLSQTINEIDEYAFANSESFEQITIYNTNCNIFDDLDTLGSAEIIGFNNSTAKSYANKYKLKFTLLDSTNCTNHSFSTKIIKPTCTAKGYTIYTCDYCGSSTKSNYISELGHSYLTTLEVKAKIGTNGKYITKCTQCNNVKSTSIIYAINQPSLSAVKYDYNGKVQTPKVTIKNTAGALLKQNSDYTISYSGNRKSVGQHSVKIVFKGIYSGSKVINYTIVPKTTKISKATAISKGFKLDWKKQKDQTNGYQIQYSTSDKFPSNNTKTKNITSNKTTSYSFKKLSSKKTYYIRIRTYTIINNTKYYSNWSSTVKVKTKK
jgi:hypothetical protein